MNRDHRLVSWMLALGVGLLSLCGTVDAFAEANDSWRSCRPDSKAVQLKSERVSWAVSPCLGGIESIQLLESQFAGDGIDVPTGAPTWAKPKFAAGAMQLISTWDAKWDPFQDMLVDVAIEDFEIGIRKGKGPEAVVEVKKFANLHDYLKHDPLFAVVQATAGSVEMVWPDPARVRSPVYLVKRYSQSEEAGPYGLEVEISVWNVAATGVQFKLQHVITNYHDPTKDDGGFLAMLAGPPDLKGAGFHADEATTHLDTSSLADADAEERNSGVTPNWLATDSRYFLLAMLPVSGYGPRATTRILDVRNGVIEARVRTEGEALASAAGSCVPHWYAKVWGGESCQADFSALGLNKAVSAEIEAPFIEAARRRGGDDQATRAAIARVQQRRVKSWNYRVYTGPKQMEALQAVDPSLEEAIDFGWFGLIARPLLSILKFAYGVSSSWPIAILFLTALIKLVLWPITTKSMRSMYKMQRLKPEMDKIREKLTEEARKKGEEKPDPQELNRQTFALYKRHGVNPLGGCLPMFIQMPVYIALYRTIYSSVELFNQPLFLWIGDLTEKDPHYVLPVLLAAVMFIQQRIMPVAGGDPTQRKMMMYGMPVMFGLMMMSLPSGLTFYILVNTVLSSVQTAYLKRTT